MSLKKISSLVAIGLSVAFSIIPNVNMNNNIKSDTKEYIKPKAEEKQKVEIDEAEEKVSTSTEEKKEVQKESIKQIQNDIPVKEKEVNNYEPPVEEKNETVYEEPIINNSEPEPVVERYIWDELGISEYDYYNSPMSSWQTVDFSVSTYGSMSAAEDACRNYGLNYEPYLNGEVAFNCDIVTSYSGNYLGYMFYTRKTY